MKTTETPRTPTGRRPSEPPIQNIPTRTKLGQLIREALIGDKR